MDMPLGTLKQEVMRIYNAVNQEMFATGVKRLRVDVLGSKILIVAEHQRVSALAALDATNRPLTRMTDVALLDANKARLKEEIEKSLPIKVRTILKDYDPFTEIAGTIIVTTEPLEVA